VAPEYRRPNGRSARSRYEGDAADPGWAAARPATPEGQVWRELQDWQDWGPSASPPAGHPSVPIRRIQFAVGYPPDQITQEAQDYAGAIREAAEREAAAITKHATDEAAAIRGAAEREASELRARLGFMSGELGRVAAYVTDSLADSALPAAAPALPAGGAALSNTMPAKPAATSARSDTRLDTRSAGLVRPRTTAATKPRKRSRQLQAMRIAACGTAALLSFAAISGGAEVGLHGYKFFVFREGGVGQTPGHETDQQFLAREAAAAHHAGSPKASRRLGELREAVLSEEKR
jgi:hypothetical protein